jgi:hypothetical protein
MEILDKLRSMFEEQWLVRSLFHLCPVVKIERMLEQSVNVKFCVQLQKSPSEISEMLKTVYGECAMSNSKVVYVCTRFRAGRKYVSKVLS